MGYVIVISAITAFLIWDFGYNEGRYAGSAILELKRLVNMVTG